MTDNELINDLYGFWKQLDYESDEGADKLYGMIEQLEFRLTQLRNIEEKYKELCK